jgi:hypothetical protein
VRLLLWEQQVLPRRPLLPLASRMNAAFSFTTNIVNKHHREDIDLI